MDVAVNELEQIHTMLNRAGIEFTEENYSCYEEPNDGIKIVIVRIEAGYIGFCSVLTFKADNGELLSIGAFEG